MAKRTVTVESMETPGAEADVLNDFTGDEDDREEERARRMAPYRAVHEQQNDQDDLLAEALFEIDLLKLGL